MTVKDAVLSGRKYLEKTDPDTAFLDSLLLLCSTLSVGKERLLARWNEPLPEPVRMEYFSLLERRKSGVPVSYITGVKEFFGLPFRVDPRVLVPRPDTEILVERALALIDADPGVKKVHDVCTGSGCIAVTLKHERPSIEVSASDISEDALEVCRENAIRVLGTELPLYLSDLLCSVEGTFDLITANPPYVTSDETRSILDAGGAEPTVALDGGEDGLSTIRRLAIQAMDSLSRAGYLLLEIGYNQAYAVTEIMFRSGYTDITCIQDLGGRDRAVIGRKGV